MGPHDAAPAVVVADDGYDSHPSDERAGLLQPCAAQAATAAPAPVLPPPLSLPRGDDGAPRTPAARRVHLGGSAAGLRASHDGGALSSGGESACGAGEGAPRARRGSAGGGGGGASAGGTCGSPHRRPRHSRSAGGAHAVPCGAFDDREPGHLRIGIRGSSGGGGGFGSFFVPPGGGPQIVRSPSDDPASIDLAAIGGLGGLAPLRCSAAAAALNARPPLPPLGAAPLATLTSAGRLAALAALVTLSLAGLSFATPENLHAVVAVMQRHPGTSLVLYSLGG